MPWIKVCDFGVAKFQVQRGSWGQMTNQVPDPKHENAFKERKTMRNAGETRKMRWSLEHL